MSAHRSLLVGIAVALVALAAAFTLVSATAGARADDKPSGSSVGLNFSGTGTVRLAPDTAVFTITLVERAANRAAASKALSAKTSTLRSRLKALGVRPRDIQTQALSVGENYETGKGFRASSSLEIRTHKIAKVGQLIAVGAAMGDIAGPTFSIEKPERAYGRALRRAVADARAKAAVAARAVDAEVGQAVSVRERAGQQQPPVFIAAEAATDMAMTKGAPRGNVSTAPGRTAVTVVVDVRFEIDR